MTERLFTLRLLLLALILQKKIMCALDLECTTFANVFVINYLIQLPIVRQKTLLCFDLNFILVDTECRILL